VLRNDLLTRRIRRALRVFRAGPRKYHHGAIPDIDWNEDLVPKDLYPAEDLIAAREERDFAQEDERMKEQLIQQERRRVERLKGDKAAKRRADGERIKQMQKIHQREVEKKVAEKKRKEEEKEQKRKREEEEESKRKEGEEEEHKKRKEEEEKERRRKEEEDRKRKEEEEKERRRKEEEDRKREQEEEKERRRKEDEDKKREQENEERRKGKGKEITPEKHQPATRTKAKTAVQSQAPSKKRSRREFKSKEMIEDSDEQGQTDGPSTIPAPKKQRIIPDPMDSNDPDTCVRCERLELKCIPNGYLPNGNRMACQTCRTHKRNCSLAQKSSSGGLPPTKPQARQSSIAARQQPPPPPAVNLSAAPLSHQVVKVKRKRVVKDAGEGGPSKIRKVRLVVPVPAGSTSRTPATTSAHEEEASSVKIPEVRVLREAKPELRVISWAEGEKLCKFALLIFLRYLNPYSCSRR